MNVLGLIIKATRECNLRCTYCHDWRSRAKPMSFSTLAQMMTKAIQNQYYKRMDFIWHGGEPLLLGKEFYEKALYLQEKLKTEDQSIRNSLQTNATLLDDEWCRFFKKYNFDVGVSIDGPELLHNVNRVYASGKGSYSEVVRGIKLLQKHDIRFGLLMVLNHQALSISPDKLFDFFYGLDATSFSFLPARPDNIVGEKTGEVETPDYLSPKEFTDFMKVIFDKWYQLDKPEIRIRELTSITHMLLGGYANVCTLAGNCLGKYFHIEANGDVYHCDKYLGDTDYHLGNIVNHTFEEICRSEKILTLVEKEKENIAKLKNNCEYFSFCNGGCPHDRYIAEKYYSNYDGTCCRQKELIEYMNEKIVSDIKEKSPQLLEEVEWH